MSGGDCHVASIQEAAGSSETITHRLGKHRDFQKPLLVSLHTDIWLLRLLISSNRYRFERKGRQNLIVNLDLSLNSFRVKKAEKKV